DNDQSAAEWLQGDENCDSGGGKARRLSLTLPLIAMVNERVCLRPALSSRKVLSRLNGGFYEQ
ncbi:MAG: hypothetical protein ACLROR_10995, partial [Klebsiella michiganensis]